MALIKIRETRRNRVGIQSPPLPLCARVDGGSADDPLLARRQRPDPMAAAAPRSRWRVGCKKIADSRRPSLARACEEDGKAAFITRVRISFAPPRHAFDGPALRPSMGPLKPSACSAVSA